MTCKELATWVETDKGRFEFMRSAGPVDEVARVLAAFSNSAGGTLLMGVAEDLTVIGLENAAARRKELLSELDRSVRPRPLWTLELEHVEGRAVLVLRVTEGKEKPYMAEGGVYLVRISGKVGPASPEDLTAMIKASLKESNRWESRSLKGAGIDDLDIDLVKVVAEKAVKAQRWHGDPGVAESFLRDFRLLNDEGITNAGMALFGKEPWRFFPQVRTRLVIGPKGKLSEQFGLDKSFDECLIRQADRIPDTLQIHIAGVRSVFIDSTWERKDFALYAPKAVREGILNALMHRDYEMSATTVIELDPGSLSITNPGAVPPGLTANDLRRRHISIQRNQDIVQVFHAGQFIEQLGRGTQLILEECRKIRSKSPRWDLQKTSTTLTFFAPPLGTSGSEHELDDRQMKVVTLLRERKRMKAEDLKELFGSSIEFRTQRAILQSLVETGWVIKLGSARSTFYELARTEQQS